MNKLLTDQEAQQKMASAKLLTTEPLKRNYTRIPNSRPTADRARRTSRSAIRPDLGLAGGDQHIGTGSGEARYL